jgi:transcriptional regulator with XRE-family HTH domain
VEEDPDQLIKDVGRRIAELREVRGLSQSELARKLGISPGNLYRIEQGQQNLTLRTMAKLASTLGVRTVDLFEGPAHAQSPRGTRR